VWLIEPCEYGEEIEGLRLKAIEKLAQGKRAATKTRSHEFRTWTDSTGKFSVEARFAGYAMGVLKLQKKDGTTLKVPLERLSAADKEYVRGLAR
jgi:hypothetical protein